jgi:hypothetical protein
VGSWRSDQLARVISSTVSRLAISQVTQSELTELTAKTQFSQSVLEVAGRQSSQFLRSLDVSPVSSEASRLTELTDVGLTLAVFEG